MEAKKEAWGSRLGLILAMAGNAVGLGNFLRFPVQAVRNGGGAFIIPYLVCFILMGLPLLWIEWSMGRFGGRSGHHSTPFILDKMARGRLWKYFGVFGIFTNIVVTAYYCYIESWTLSYVWHSLTQTFADMSQSEVADFFTTYVTLGESTTGIPYEALVFYVICLALNTFILSQGLSGGVERVAKIAVPMLLVFGAMLALRGWTLGDSGSPEGCVDCDAFLGLNFLWEPDFKSLSDPGIWLAAAGQIFFTLSVGMGSIHCYASYIESKDDIALNAMSAGWMNGFVEIVLGSSIVIPIAVGYLGLDWVVENAGFSMAFQTMPYLFGQWGPVLATFAGLFWFGILFFAGITSTLAMGTPWLGFMEDEFNWPRKTAAWSFGGIVLLFGLPTVLFYNQGVFDEYDYWGGTVSLVVFALAESLIFAWIYGINNGWEELNRGADINIPLFFKPVMKYVTPLMLLVIFLSALVTPVNNAWKEAFQGNWELDSSSIIGKVLNKEITANRDYWSDYFEAEASGTIVSVVQGKKGKQTVKLAKKFSYYRDELKRPKLFQEGLSREGIELFDSLTVVGTYPFGKKTEILVEEGQQVTLGEPIAKGSFINRIAYIDFSKLMLSALFLFICYLVYRAGKSRKPLNQ